jgi:cytochrome P450
MDQSLLQPVFSRSTLTNLGELEHHTQVLISRIPKDGTTVELQELFLNFTFDSGLGIILGLPHDNSEFEIKEQAQLERNIGTVLFEAGRRSKVGLFRILDPILRPRKFWGYLNASWGVHSYFDRIIGHRLKEINQEAKVQKASASTESQNSGRYIFLDALAGATQDPKQLRWELSTVLSGSRDTTAGLLTHTFWELARNPDVWVKLQKEVDELEGKPPTYEDLKSGFIYLKAVLQEGILFLLLFVYNFIPPLPPLCEFHTKYTTT